MNNMLLITSCFDIPTISSILQKSIWLFLFGFLCPLVSCFFPPSYKLFLGLSVPYLWWCLQFLYVFDSVRGFVIAMHLVLFRFIFNQILYNYHSIFQENVNLKCCLLAGLCQLRIFNYGQFCHLWQFLLILHPELF